MGDGMKSSAVETPTAFIGSACVTKTPSGLNGKLNKTSIDQTKHLTG